MDAIESNVIKLFTVSKDRAALHAKIHVAVFCLCKKMAYLTISKAATQLRPRQRSWLLPCVPATILLEPAFYIISYNWFLLQL